eukprot:327124_1
MSASTELQENFAPKEQNKDTAQTIFPREIIKQFAKRRSDWEGGKQVLFHVALLLFAQFLVYITALNVHSEYRLLIILNLASKVFCGYIISFLFHGEHECVHHTAFKTPILNHRFRGNSNMLNCNGSQTLFLNKY